MYFFLSFFPFSLSSFLLSLLFSFFLIFLCLSFFPFYLSLPPFSLYLFLPFCWFSFTFFHSCHYILLLSIYMFNFISFVFLLSPLKSLISSLMGTIGTEMTYFNISPFSYPFMFIFTYLIVCCFSISKWSP